MSGPLEEALERFDDAVGRADQDAALAVVSDLLTAGVEPLTILEDLIAPVQRRVGERWQSGEWPVAREHAATSVSAVALEAVSRAVSREPDPARHAVVACAEGEWHALPAGMIAAGLRSAGWRVTLLGASTPAARLTRYLQDLGPRATVISCSVAAALPAARDFVRASTTAGIPVLVGGAAFGPDRTRADALGATAWAADLRTAVETAGTLPLVVPPLPPPAAGVTADEAALRADRRALTQAVVTRCRGTLPPSADADLGASGDSEALLGTAVQQAYHALVGALVTGDGRLVEETAAWADQLLGSQVAGELLASTIGRAMAAELSDHPRAALLWSRHWPLTAAARPG